MGEEAGVVLRGGMKRIEEAPEEAKEVDIGYRIAAHRPVPSSETLLGDPEHLFPAFDADPARGMDR